MQLSSLVLTALAGLASAQTTHVVTVAWNASLTYSPEKLTAQPGDFVQFQFHAGNHTVTQSTFDNPCQPSAMHSNVTGFHSGFLPVAASAEMGMIPTYTVRINSTGPLWLYCAQGRHCQNGMVMVINEPTNPERSLEAYKSLAAEADTAWPGGAPGSGGETGSIDAPDADTGNDNDNDNDDGTGTGTDADDATTTDDAEGAFETAGAVRLLGASPLAAALVAVVGAAVLL